MRDFTTNILAVTSQRTEIIIIISLQVILLNIRSWEIKAKKLYLLFTFSKKNFIRFLRLG